MVAPTIRTPVLMYHSIARRSSSAFRRYCVDPALFEEHMAALAARDYEALTVTELVDLRLSGREAPTRSVVVTFDDAFADFHHTALETLTRHGFTATLYVPTAYVGGTSRWLSPEGEGSRPVLSWSALAEVAAAGIDVGSHSCSHPQLDLLPPVALRAELEESRRMLEERLQRAVLSLAYPFGYHTARVRSAARAAGYRSACAVRDLSSTAADDPFALNRLTVPHGMPVEALLRCVTASTGRASALRVDAHANASRLLRRARSGKRGFPSVSTR